VTQDVLDAIARLDFYTFVKMVFREIAAGEELVPGWHLEAMCYAVSEVGLRRRRRQIIEVPPRSLKSICVSVALPAWLLVAIQPARSCASATRRCWRPISPPSAAR